MENILKVILFKKEAYGLYYSLFVLSEYYQSESNKLNTLQNNIQDLKNMKKDLSEKMRSVQSLIVSKHRLQLEIEQEEKNKLPSQKTNFNLAVAVNDDVDLNIKSNSLLLNTKQIILAFSLMIGLLSPLFYIISGDSKNLFVALMLILFYISFTSFTDFLSINKQKQDISKNQLNYSDSIENIKEFDDFMQRLSYVESHKSTNIDIIEQLKKQIDKISLEIYYRLGNKSIESIAKERDEITSEINKIERELRPLENRLFSVEEYLEIRRQMDIIEIEQDIDEFVMDKSESLIIDSEKYANLSDKEKTILEGVINFVKNIGLRIEYS